MRTNHNEVPESHVESPGRALARSCKRIASTAIGRLTTVMVSPASILLLMCSADVSLRGAAAPPLDSLACMRIAKLARPSLCTRSLLIGLLLRRVVPKCMFGPWYVQQRGVRVRPGLHVLRLFFAHLRCRLLGSGRVL